MEKLVTVYMPTRDRSPLAARAIHSVLAQTWPAFELIVVDDGSRPENYDKLRAAYEQENRVRLVRQAESRGASAARNRAIELARGEFITGLDDDDTFTPQRLERFIEAWAKQNPDGRYSALFTRQLFGERLARHVEIVGEEDLLCGNYIGNQVFTLTERLRAIGGFDEDMPALQDYETWLRLTRRFGPALGLAEPTYVVDFEHPLERISGKSADLLQRACDIIAAKHALDATQRRRLKAVMFSYPQVSMSLGDLLEQWRLGNYGQASRTYLAKKLGLQA